jgi:hypothetical protein
MSLLKTLVCKIFGYCIEQYTEECDPTAQRFVRIENRVTHLEDNAYWKPRDLFDLR